MKSIFETYKKYLLRREMSILQGFQTYIWITEKKIIDVEFYRKLHDKNKSLFYHLLLKLKRPQGLRHLINNQYNRKEFEEKLFIFGDSILQFAINLYSKSENNTQKYLENSNKQEYEKYTLVAFDAIFS